MINAIHPYYPNQHISSSIIPKSNSRLPRILPLLQNPLRNQHLRLRPIPNLLLEAISAHMPFQLARLRLEGWGCGC